MQSILIKRTRYFSLRRAFFALVYGQKKKRKYSIHKSRHRKYQRCIFYSFVLSLFHLCFFAGLSIPHSTIPIVWKLYLYTQLFSIKIKYPFVSFSFVIVLCDLYLIEVVVKGATDLMGMHVMVNRSSCCRCSIIFHVLGIKCKQNGN